MKTGTTVLPWMMMMMILSKYYYLIGIIFLLLYFAFLNIKKTKTLKWLNNSLPATTPDSQRVYNIFSVWIIRIRNILMRLGIFVSFFSLLRRALFPFLLTSFLWGSMATAVIFNQICMWIIVYIVLISQQRATFLFFPTKITSLKSSSCFLLHCAVSLSGAFIIIAIIIVHFGSWRHLTQIYLYCCTRIKFAFSVFECF